MEIKKSNPYAAIMVLLLSAVLFIGFWSFLPVFAKIHDISHDDSNLEKYVTEEDCKDSGNYWVNGACSKLSSRAEQVISLEKTAWLTAPFVFVFGLILWLISKATNKDYQEYQ